MHVKHLCKYQYSTMTKGFYRVPKFFFVRTLLGYLLGRVKGKVRNYSKYFVRKHVALKIVSLLGCLANNRRKK